MPDRDPDVRIAIEHSIKMLGRWTVVLFLAIAIVFGWSYLVHEHQSDKLEAVATETASALCSFRDDLQRRADSTREYLQKHEGLEPIPGITRGDLRRSLQNQQATLDSLAGLPCPGKGAT